MNEERTGAGTGPGAVATPPVAPLPRARLRLVGMALGAVLTIGIAATVVVLRQPDSTASVEQSQVPASWIRPAVSSKDLVDRSGVELIRVAETGGGGLLDLRFKVVDPDKAAEIHDATTPPAIIDESTGLVVHQLLMDHAHTGPMKAALTYYLVFENTGGWVRRGSTVSVLLGAAQVEHVTVQ